MIIYLRMFVVVIRRLVLIFDFFYIFVIRLYIFLLIKGFSFDIINRRFIFLEGRNWGRMWVTYVFIFVCIFVVRVIGVGFVILRLWFGINIIFIFDICVFRIVVKSWIVVLVRVFGCVFIWMVNLDIIMFLIRYNFGMVKLR